MFSHPTLRASMKDLLVDDADTGNGNGSVAAKLAEDNSLQEETI